MDRYKDEVEIEALEIDGVPDQANILAALRKPVPDRILLVAQAFRYGWRSKKSTKPARSIVGSCGKSNRSCRLKKMSAPTACRKPVWICFRLKKAGFSDERLAELAGRTAGAVADHRRALDVIPSFKRIDTCAAEFPSMTPYMYSAYEGDGLVPGESETEITDREKVVILGGGPNRIGQGIEFDYCCVHAVFALRDAGYETIMVNCNPETVSTDYDTSDRLYFEPLTDEDVIELVRGEQARGSVKGVIVQFGGQTPLQLARPRNGRYPDIGNEFGCDRSRGRP